MKHETLHAARSAPHPILSDLIFSGTSSNQPIKAAKGEHLVNIHQNRTAAAHFALHLGGGGRSGLIEFNLIPHYAARKRENIGRG